MKLLLTILTLNFSATVVATPIEKPSRLVRFVYETEETCERFFDSVGRVSLLGALSKTIDTSILKARHWSAIVRGREREWMAEYNRHALHPPESQVQRTARLRNRFAALDVPRFDHPADLLAPITAFAAATNLDLHVVRFDRVLFTNVDAEPSRLYRAGTIVLLDKDTNLVVSHFVLPSRRLGSDERTVEVPTPLLNARPSPRE